MGDESRREKIENIGKLITAYKVYVFSKNVCEGEPSVDGDVIRAESELRSAGKKLGLDIDDVARLVKHADKAGKNAEPDLSDATIIRDGRELNLLAFLKLQVSEKLGDLTGSAQQQPAEPRGAHTHIIS